MEKKTKDYLHLYLNGCMVERNTFGSEDDVPTGKTGREATALDETMLAMLLEEEDEGVFKPKLILRPLSDMTDSEAANFGYSKAIDWLADHREFGVHSALRFLKLLQSGFDIFGLIEDGLAIDKTKIKIESRPSQHPTSHI